MLGVARGCVASEGEMMGLNMEVMTALRDFKLAKDEIVGLKAEVEELKAENFSLATHQCKYPAGDEHGNARCLEVERLEAKVKRFHDSAQKTLKSIVPLVDEVEKLRKALKLARDFLIVQRLDGLGEVIEVIGKALKGE